MCVAIYPGSFDPPTLGHLDIIRRTCARFDKVVVCVMHNSAKPNSMFTCKERKEMLEEITADFPNLRVDTFCGLLADYVEKYKNPVVIRGLRAVSDFEYELQMASVNKKLNDKIETVYMLASNEYTFLSSSVVRELASYGRDLSAFVPEAVEKAILNKLNNSSDNQ